MNNETYKKTLDEFFANNFNKLLKLFKTHKYLCKLYRVDAEEMVSEIYIYMLSYPFFFSRIGNVSISLIKDVFFSSHFAAQMYNKFIHKERQEKKLIEEYRRLFYNYNNLTQLEVEIMVEMYINGRTEGEVANMYNIKSSTLKNKLCIINKKQIGGDADPRT